MNKLNFCGISDELRKIEDMMKLLTPVGYSYYDVSLITFTQYWGNTSGGLEDFGCCAITKQQTYVLHNERLNSFHVFFGTSFGYEIDGNNVNDLFYEDLNSRNLKGKRRYIYYLER